MKSTNNYIDNKKLREDLCRFILENPYDTGDWLEKNAKRSGNKEFCIKRRKHIDELQKKLSEMSDDERRKYIDNYNVFRERFFKDIEKIVEGRMASYKSLWAREDFWDLKQSALIQCYQYMNRYDTDGKTSAFAYITQIISNALNLYLQLDNDSQWCRVPMKELEGNVGSKEYFGQGIDKDKDYE